jgi:preprotein translocase subunit YajC
LDYTILMSAQPQGGQGGAGSMLVSLVPIILIFVIFWLLLIRPQQKRQKEHRKLLTQLRKGDRVVTNGGMFGVISSLNDEKNIVVLKIAENTKIEILKSSIAGKVE